MNKLDLFTGGHPFQNDDLKFIQDATREAIAGLVKVRGDNYRLSGAVFAPVGPNDNLTEGYVVLNGEVCYVPARIYTVSPVSPVWVIQESVDTSISPVLYEDGLPKSPHLLRRATVEGDTGQAFKVPVGELEDDWRLPAYSPSWSADTVNSEALQYRKLNGRLQFKGGAAIGSFVNGIIFTLPAGFRPLAQRQFTIAAGNNDGSNNDKVVNIKIKTNGTVNIHNVNATASIALKCWFDSKEVEL